MSFLGNNSKESTITSKETKLRYLYGFCQIDFNAVDVMYTVTHEKINSYKFNFGIGSSSLARTA